MKLRFEYIRLYFDWQDLSELNRYSSDGWRVVGISEVVVRTLIETSNTVESILTPVALLEREIHS